MNTNYAGFWKRVGAYLLDVIILNIFMMIVFLIFGIVMGVKGEGIRAVETVANGGIIYLAQLILYWIYHAVMESSGKQATLGKMAVGIKVTSIDGERIGFLQASGRYFGQIISVLTLGFGYLMVAFTERKQALHDIMAGCLVLEKEAYVESDEIDSI